MTEYTTHRGLPYPSSQSPVVVHEDIELLAVKTDVELNEAATQVQELQKGAVPPGVENLFSMDQTVPGILSTAGQVLPHDTQRTTGFIPVQGGSTYSSRADVAHRIVFFDANQDHISGTPTDWMVGNEIHHWDTPVNAHYARVGVGPTASIPYPNVIFNRGTELWKPHGLVSSGWWDDRERPPLGRGEVDIGSLSFAQHGRIAQEFVDGAVPPRVTNLFDPDDTVPGTLAEDGVIVDHDTNRTTGFIPVTAGEPYVSMTPLRVHRIVWFDGNQDLISGTDTSYMPTGVPSYWVAPDDAAYARIGIALSEGIPMDGITFNRGTELWEPGKEVTTGWWEDREQPPGATLNEEHVTKLVESLLPQYEPSVPTMQFETIHTGSPEPYWLSQDGQVLYGRDQLTLIQSLDEWATHQHVMTFDGTVQAIRDLEDGELLVSINKNTSDPTSRARIMRSYGYTRDNPENATWEIVATSLGEDALVNNSWGMSVYQNIVVAGEYGLRGDEGARLVWLSEDHGQTFTQVFDQKTVEAEGRPAWTQSGHVHTAAWDPYWSRIWVVTGDANNNATYYSDDKGASWTFVERSDQMQYTGIIALPDVVVFGSDAPPNGIHVYRRGTKTDMPNIRPAYLIDDSDVITSVFQLAYKRDWQPTTPTYFAASTANQRGPSVIVGTVDGKKFHTLWEGEQPGSGVAHSGDIRWPLGPTAQGNIIAYMMGDPTVTGARVMKAPAPTWARA